MNEPEQSPQAVGFVAAKVIAFPQVLGRIAASNPSFHSFQPRIRAAQALVRQAALLPNPVLESQIEEFGGDTDGFSESETSIAVVQPLLLGGKVSARVELARWEKAVQELDAALLVSSVITEAKEAYASVVYGQKALAIAAEQLRFSKEVLKAADRKLHAGAILAVEKTRAEIALRNAELTVQNRESELQVARLSLAALWRGEPSEIGELLGQDTLYETEALLKPVSATATPLYKTARARVQAATARLAVEESRAVPDASVGVGYKRLQESESNSLLGIFSIDLPVFDRNQGSIESARQSLHFAQLERDRVQLSVEREANALQSSLRALLNEQRALTQTILPQAQLAFEQARAAYEQGKTSYLDLLDTQQTLLDAQLRSQAVALSANQKSAQLEQLCGVTMTKALEILE